MVTDGKSVFSILARLSQLCFRETRGELDAVGRAPLCLPILGFQLRPFLTSLELADELRSLCLHLARGSLLGRGRGCLNARGLLCHT